MDSMMLEEAGLIYKLMPYVNYVTLLLCDMPDEKGVAALRINEIAKCSRVITSENLKA